MKVALMLSDGKETRRRPRQLVDVLRMRSAVSVWSDRFTVSTRVNPYEAIMSRRND